jgi:hypothetical protein
MPSGGIPPSPSQAIRNTAQLKTDRTADDPFMMLMQDYRKCDNNILRINHHLKVALQPYESDKYLWAEFGIETAALSGAAVGSEIMVAGACFVLF